MEIGTWCGYHEAILIHSVVSSQFTKPQKKAWNTNKLVDTIKSSLSVPETGVLLGNGAHSSFKRN